MNELGSVLSAAIARHRTPGASLVVATPAATLHACAGVTSSSAPRPVTPTTIFRLGSMTKAITACGVMQLVEEGLLDLDQRVCDLAPGFRTADPELSSCITVRHLLNHTAGFFGDCFDDTGEGADAWARYVAGCRELQQFAVPGSVMSYCNAGFVVLAHLTERLRNCPWDELIVERVLRPLGMRRSGMRLALMPTEDAAVSHVVGVDGEPTPMLNELAPLSCAPAGSTGWTTATDAVAFGQMLLHGGTGPEGRSVLHARTVCQMRAERIQSPSPSFAAAWGLGLMVFDDKGEVFGHDGAVAGQWSWLRVSAADELVFALFVNGGDAKAVFEEVFAAVTDHYCSTPLPRVPPLPPPLPGFDPSPYVGRYRSQRYHVDVSARPGGLMARFVPAANAGDFGAPFEVELRPDPLAQHAMTTPTELFLGYPPGSSIPGYQRFSAFSNGRATRMHFRGRLFIRDT